MNEIVIVDVPVEYSSFLKMQRETHERQAEEFGSSFFIVEHLPVYTRGRHFRKDTIPTNFDIPVIDTDRGGNTTYHAPGQLIIYPIIHLPSLKITIKEYISRLEQLGINLATQWGIAAERDIRNNGVWVSGKKLASLGISVKRGVTMHGIAININLDMAPFRFIDPCGLVGIEMSSFAEELSQNIDILEVKQSTKHLIPHIFPECF